MAHDDPPNVVWIAMEDTSPRFGCYGDDIARTPNVDRLASTGRRYSNAYCTAGVCAPSRASIVTGMYPPAIGAHHMRTSTHDREGLPDPYEAVPPHYVTAFTERLREAGYYCTLDAKTDYQFGEPFTMWDCHGDGAGWWDDDREEGQPFFAMFTNGVTHESGMWPPDADDRFGGADDGSLDTDPDAVSVPPYLPDTEPTRRAIARQYDNVARADDWIGGLLDRLRDDGHAEDTVVVLWSDHGEGLPRKKRWPYDSGTHVPLIVRWPGELDAGDESERLVSLVDLGPSMLSIAGVDVPRYVHGRPFLGPQDDGPRQYAYATRDRYDEEYDMVRSVRDERYRYVRHYYPDRPYVQWIPYRNRHPAMRELLRLDAEDELSDEQARWFANRRPAEELYDLREDPHEVNDLSDDPAYSHVLERLRTALDDWRRRVGDDRAADEAETELRERIWPGGDQPTTATPLFVPNAPDNRAREPMTEDGTLDGPVTLSLYCATQGASIAYTFDEGADPHWELYAGPIRLDSGETTIRTRAVRYGYEESEERRITIDVT